MCAWSGDLELSRRLRRFLTFGNDSRGVSADVDAILELRRHCHPGKLSRHVIGWKRNHWTWECRTMVARAHRVGLEAHSMHIQLKDARTWDFNMVSIVAWIRASVFSEKASGSALSFKSSGKCLGLPIGVRDRRDASCSGTIRSRRSASCMGRGDESMVYDIGDR